MKTPSGLGSQWLRHSFDDFARAVSGAPSPVVLLEGSRDVPAAVQNVMERLATHLLRRFPTMIARSGNAEGSDQAWARGVNAVAPNRLNLVLPVRNYKRVAIAPGNDVLPLDDAPPPATEAALRLTRDHYAFGSRQGARAFDPLPAYKKNYLIRDALKVLGAGGPPAPRAKATAALFYLNPAKAGGGGTGHTVRLCEAAAVPYFLADDWLTWL